MPLDITQTGASLLCVQLKIPPQIKLLVEFPMDGHSLEFYAWTL